MIYDKDIREPLFDFLEETYGKTRIIEEKKMGASRADIVMIIEGAVVGIEIKSDADTYTRLATQVKDYDRYCDMNIVAIGTSHAAHIFDHVPEYWGIITVEEVEGRLDFYMLRRPQANPKMKWENKLKLLWRPELAQIQEMNQLPKYKDKSKAFVIERLASFVPERVAEDVLKEQVSEILFERDYNTIRDQINSYRQANGKRRRRKNYVWKSRS